MKTGEDCQQSLQNDFEVQDREEFASIQSTKKRRVKCLVVCILLMVVVVIVATVVPLVVLQNRQISVTKTSSNSSAGKASDEWGLWGICSATCGNGIRQRMRECKNLDNSSCNVTTQRLPCQMKPCIHPSIWGHWSQWSSCSKTCATGIQSRNRNCTNKDLDYGDRCFGDKMDTRNCTHAECTRIDCSDWLRSGQTSNGIYTVDPDGRGSFSVYCYMDKDVGGWTVFQRRQDGVENFFRDWDDYKTGFGNLSGEFWLGNDKLHRLTASMNASLYILLGDWSGRLYNASYGVFRVDSERNNYTLTVSSYSGNATDSMTYHNNMRFTTKDRDNDQENASNCARGYRGGWWYKYCIRAHLNGRYVGNKNDRQGLVWYSLTSPHFTSMKTTQMSLRPAGA